MLRILPLLALAFLMVSCTQEEQDAAVDRQAERVLDKQQLKHEQQQEAEKERAFYDTNGNDANGCHKSLSDDERRQCANDVLKVQLGELESANKKTTVNEQ